MHTFVPISEKLIALNIAILKIDLEFFEDIFTNTSKALDLQGSIFADISERLHLQESIFADTSEKLNSQESVFADTSEKLHLQESVFSQRDSTNTSNIIQQPSEKLLLSTHIMEKFVSGFGEKNTSTKILERNSLASVDKLKVSNQLDFSSQLSNAVSDNFSSISQLSNLEHTTPELHTPTSINSSDFFTRNFKEKSISNSKNSSAHSTNIYIDKVEVNDVSNVNDLALQLQQKVSTL